MKLTASFLLLLATTVSCAGVAYGQVVCPAKSRIVSYGIYNSGDTVEGPVCVKVYYNALRYDIGLNVTVTTTSGPDPAGAVTAPKAGGGVPGAGQDTIEQIKAELSSAEGTLQGYRTQDDAAAANLSNAVATLGSVVDLSNTAFDQGGATAVLALLNTGPVTSALAIGTAVSWKATDDFIDKLQELKDRVTKLQAGNPSPADAASLQTRIALDLTAVTPYTQAGDKTSSFLKQKVVFMWWGAHINNLNANAFTAQVFVGCNISTNTNKANVVKVSGLDNFPRFASQQPTALTIGGNVANVTCSTPFVISAGMEISFLKSPTYGLVPSGTTGAKQFGITDNGGINPMALAMAHWRLHDFVDHKLGLYGSFGTAAHVQASAAGGSSAEYVSGFSLGFFRTAFVTAGWHLGKVGTLDGGYTVGSPVPTGVTTVPVISSYKSGFGLAITFTKP